MSDIVSGPENPVVNQIEQFPALMELIPWSGGENKTQKTDENEFQILTSTMVSKVPGDGGMCVCLCEGVCGIL